jgi:hypothetical protein
VRRFLLAGVVVTGLGLAPAAHATFPGTNGKIAYLKPGSTCLQLVNADGTGQTEPGRCDIDRVAAISPDGKRVVSPIYNAADDVYDYKVTNLDGTGSVRIPGGGIEGTDALHWSHDQSYISMLDLVTCRYCAGHFLSAARADGSTFATNLSYASGGGSWSLGGRIVYGDSSFDDVTGGSSSIWTTKPDGTDRRLLVSASGGDSVGSPAWSPSGDRIVFAKSGQIAVMNADGSGLQTLTNTSSGYNFNPQWSLDGSKILFGASRDGNYEIYSMNPDGSDQTNLTNNGAVDENAIWSPDSRKIAFQSTRDGGYDIYVMNRDGTGITQLTDNAGSLQDWQALLAGYPRPKGAGPLSISLVPAYKPCGSPNSTHGSPLASPSCNPPVPASDYLTVGTADSNGKPTKSYGSLVTEVQLGDPTTPADEADVKLTFDLKDVRSKSNLTDYTGELLAQESARLTDKYNGYGGASATAKDLAYSFVVPCSATADATIGSECALTTTADTLVPGAIKEGKRAVWELGQLQVFDGGSDGLASTAGNTLFEVQGVFVP